MPVKRNKIILAVLQAVMIALLFLPIARVSGSEETENTLGLVRRYKEFGYQAGSLAYLLFALCGPVMTTLCLWRLNDRKNFAAAAWLDAIATLANACFYTAVKNALTGSVTVTKMNYAVVFFGLAVLAWAIYSYLMAAPDSGGSAKR